mgnify:CR=1 FL=1
MKGKLITFLLMVYCILMPFEEAIAFGFGSVLKICWYTHYYFFHLYFMYQENFHLLLSLYFYG